MATVCTWLGVGMLTAGTVFVCLAALGICRFRTTLERQHAATKPQMLGFILIMVGVALIQRSAAWTGICLLAICLQAVTAPLGAHILARAAYGRQWLTEETGEKDDRYDGGVSGSAN